MPEIDIDAAARYLAKHVMRYSWDGLSEGRCEPFPAWWPGGRYNAQREDFRDAVRGILEAAGVKTEK